MLLLIVHELFDESETSLKCARERALKPSKIADLDLRNPYSTPDSVTSLIPWEKYF